MPLKKCQIKGVNGWKWGNKGKCYTGVGARKKAIQQAKAIEASKHSKDTRNDQADGRYMQMVVNMIATNQLIKSSGKKFKAKKPPKWYFPDAQEREYYRSLQALFSIYTDYTEENIIPRINEWVDDSKNYFDSAEIRKDQFEEEVNLYIDQGFKELDQRIYEDGQDTLFDELLAIALITSLFNKEQFQKVVAKSLGITVDIDEPFEINIARAWVNRNVGLIKGATDDYRKKIKDAVLETVMRGGTSQELSKKLLSTDNTLTKSRANIIARDQITKLNGVLTRRRQTSIGVDEYRWITANEERVRGNPSGLYPKTKPSHWVLHNKTCRWDDPTVYSDDGGKTWLSKSTINGEPLHPGFAILCRCFGEAIFDEIENEVNNYLENV